MTRLFNSPPAQETIQSRAEDGNADSQFFAGLRCASGKQGADFEHAIEWYLKAANQNHRLAQFNLGVMYSIGQGVLPDERQAEIWFDRAARQQDPGAQYNLGMSRYRVSFQGAQPQRDEAMIEAYKWFSLAAGLGYRDSDVMRDTISLKMDRQGVAEGSRRASEFLCSARAKADDNKEIPFN
jgi:TPR repeat protein